MGVGNPYIMYFIRLDITGITTTVVNHCLLCLFLFPSFHTHTLSHSLSLSVCIYVGIYCVLSTWWSIVPNILLVTASWPLSASSSIMIWLYYIKWEREVSIVLRRLIIIIIVLSSCLNQIYSDTPATQMTFIKISTF